MVTRNRSDTFGWGGENMMEDEAYWALFILWTSAHVFWFFLQQSTKNLFLVDINNWSKFHKLSLVFTPVGFQNFSSISIWKFKVTIWGYFTHSYNTCIINTWEIYKQPLIADIYHCKPYVNTYTCIFILLILNRITSWKQNLTNCSSLVNWPFIWIWNGTWNIWFTGSTEQGSGKEWLHLPGITGRHHLHRGARNAAGSYCGSSAPLDSLHSLLKLHYKK